MFSECSQFHPNRFTFGGVISERVNIAKTHRSQSSIKTAKHRITRSALYDSRLKFTDAKDISDIPTGSPQGGRQKDVGYVKIGDFRPISRYISEMVRDTATVTKKG